jgi:tetratricopeptide (TPR) repeat protein
VKAHNILGELYGSQKKIGKAVEHCNKALMLARKIGDFRGQANALGSLGNIYLKPSSWSYYNLDNAIHHYEQALAIYDQHGDQPGMITAHSMLIDAYRRQRRFGEALKHFNDAHEIAKKLKSSYHLAGLHYYAALVYNDRRERENALNHARAACEYFTRLGMRQMVDVACGLTEQLSS